MDDTMETSRPTIKISDELLANIEKIKKAMDARGIESHGTAVLTSDVVEFAINNFFMTTGRKTTGTGDEILSRINEAVKTQMKLNKTTDKKVQVGRGRNAVSVMYEQRSITDRFIRETAKVNAKATNEYMSTHGDDIQEHNEWLVKNCGYPVDSDTEFAIENFNRRTSKASKRAEILESGEVE